MTASLPEYEIYAIRYATRDALRRDHFIGGDPHESPMPMDYFVWAIIGPRRPHRARSRLHRRNGQGSASAISCAARSRA